MAATKLSVLAGVAQAAVTSMDPLEVSPMLKVDHADVQLALQNTKAIDTGADIIKRMHEEKWTDSDMLRHVQGIKGGVKELRGLGWFPIRLPYSPEEREEGKTRVYKNPDQRNRVQCLIFKSEAKKDEYIRDIFGEEETTVQAEILGERLATLEEEKTGWETPQPTGFEKIWHLPAIGCWVLRANELEHNGQSVGKWNKEWNPAAGHYNIATAAMAKQFIDSGKATPENAMDIMQEFFLPLDSYYAVNGALYFKRHASQPQLSVSVAAPNGLNKDWINMFLPALQRGGEMPTAWTVSIAVTKENSVEVLKLALCEEGKKIVITPFNNFFLAPQYNWMGSSLKSNKDTTGLADLEPFLQGVKNGGVVIQKSLSWADDQHTAPTPAMTLIMDESWDQSDQKEELARLLSQVGTDGVSAADIFGEVKNLGTAIAAYYLENAHYLLL